MQNNLQKVIEVFPEFKNVATLLNKNRIHWALAAGTATYFYVGKYPSIDEIDIFISQEDMNTVAKVLNKSWEPHSSERHKAENIKFNNFDLFTQCLKFIKDKQILNYLWTKSVDLKLKIEEIKNISYKILSPEDIILLKIANPRKGDLKDISDLKTLKLNKEYLLKRFCECKAESEVYDFAKSLGVM